MLQFRCSRGGVRRSDDTHSLRCMQSGLGHTVAGRHSCQSCRSRDEPLPRLAATLRATISDLTVRIADGVPVMCGRHFHPALLDVEKHLPIRALFPYGGFLREHQVRQNDSKTHFLQNCHWKESGWRRTYRLGRSSSYGCSLLEDQVQ